MAPKSSVERDIDNEVRKLADYLHAHPKAKVIFMIGAGVSTSCGIPDFRSPKTGLYHNLAKLNLDYAEAVFDIDYFRKNPKPFYVLSNELYPGKFTPSRFHYLMKLFYDKKRLKRIYTQNIDTLELLSGIPEEYVIAAHGSFSSCHCIDCKKVFSTELFKAQALSIDHDKQVEDILIDYVKCDECKGLIKPNIVFFGESLPKRFHDTWDQDLNEIRRSSKSDEYVIVVAGTSLTVYPFAGLPSEVPLGIHRALINNVVVGDFISPRPNDYILKGDSEEVANLLARDLNWSQELEELCKSTEDEQLSAVKKAHPEVLISDKGQEKEKATQTLPSSSVTEARIERTSEVIEVSKSTSKVKEGDKTSGDKDITAVTMEIQKLALEQSEEKEERNRKHDRL